MGRAAGRHQPEDRQWRRQEGHGRPEAMGRAASRHRQGDRLRRRQDVQSTKRAARTARGADADEQKEGRAALTA